MIHDRYFYSSDWFDALEIYNLLREISLDQNSNYQFDFCLGIHLQEAKSDTLMVTVLQLASSNLWKLKSCITT